MIEIEKTYLAKSLPKNLKSFPSKEIMDLYVPKTVPNPKLRFRKNGDTFELTKKELLNPSDFSIQKEQTIILSQEEFNWFEHRCEGKVVHKIRYFYNYNGLIAEFDIFKGDLLGLVIVDFEFESPVQMDNFVMPDFCLADITQEKTIAGGLLADCKLDELESLLNSFGYKKLYL